jgi:hypothetical protein
MLANADSQSNSTAVAKSVLVITATSALLNMVGYLSSLSSPSVTESRTSRRFSSKSYEDGQRRLPTFSMKRKSNSAKPERTTDLSPTMSRPVQ